MPRFPAIFPLSSLDGSNGFEITGVDQSGGQSVSAAGDINNDGFGDLIIGASEADPNGMGSGASYVMFGKAGGFGASISLSTLNGGNGFKISGAAMLDHSGFSVASAGDVNGDGFDDLIVGAPGVVPGGATYSRGASYVIFGKAAGFAANLNLSALNGSNGFRIDGVADVDLSGTSVHSASDVNGDGFDDLIIGSPYANVNNLLRDYGAVDVVFGKAGGFGPVFDLATLDGRNGFNISGERENDNAGLSVSSAGDFDGDGLNDMIVGSEAGRAYVVYGNSRNFDPEIHLNSIANLGGFKLIGARPAEQAGRAVSGVGDVNGDGFDDIILGAPFAGTINTGACHVVFGSATRPIDNVRLTDLDGSNGFKIAGVLPGDFSGAAVSAAGDINGDGFADILIGAPDADPNGSSSGASYVIFGKAAAFNTVFRLASLNGRNGFQITGEVVGDTSGTSVSAAGDVNGDGFDDLIVGAPGAGGLTDNGASYVIFGHATGALNRRGTEGDDILSGGEFDDTFSGRGGNDLIRSDGGNDVIAGGEGNDTLNAGDGDDEISGGGGNDRISGGAGSDLISGGDGNDIIIASVGSESIDGGTGTDLLNFTGFSAGVTIDLTLGTFLHPNGTDRQFFTLIEDVLGGSGADTITGDKNANGLSGGGGNDVLIGGRGADILNGGTGRDTVTGGEGLDIFVFKSVSSSPAGPKRDTITDYTFKETIDLSAIDADASLLGNNAFTFRGTAGFSKAGQINVTQSGADTIIAINTEGTSGAEMEIVLSNYMASALTASDFIL